MYFHKTRENYDFDYTDAANNLSALYDGVLYPELPWMISKVEDMFIYAQWLELFQRINAAIAAANAEEVKETVANDDLTGKYVELLGDEGIWWKVTSDNGNRVEVTCVTTNLPLAPTDICSKTCILNVMDMPQGFTITKL